MVAQGWSWTWKPAGRVSPHHFPSEFAVPSFLCFWQARMLCILSCRHWQELALFLLGYLLARAFCS